MEKLIKEWEACQLMKVFEFEVIDRRTGDKTWLTFDVSLVGGQFIAQHEALSEDQAASELIASVQIEIDADFSLDENLQALHDACTNALSESTFFCWPGVYEREQLEKIVISFRLF